VNSGRPRGRKLGRNRKGNDLLRARYYDTATAQFISRDPAVGTTRQPYAYVGDNPINSTDPAGLYNCGWSFWNCISLPSSPGEAVRRIVGNTDHAVQAIKPIVPGRAGKAVVGCLKTVPAEHQSVGQLRPFYQ
jgi:RHS repeat-associated protein